MKRTNKLLFLNVADPTIANDGTSHHIISSMQMGKGRKDEMFR